ncbi:uncharacterized protein LOC129654245 [Bubalus kerabau]|uniref:uncharacterized protein LOC129654245 n=1 Tax=Bubalus carabanensis TaxID=3119969 RepID=UPI00244EC6B8|nr:uncharacterized protein LOC129654245 [Bubalus carabanensis]
MELDFNVIDFELQPEGRDKTNSYASGKGIKTQSQEADPQNLRFNHKLGPCEVEAKHSRSPTQQNFSRWKLNVKKTQHSGSDKKPSVLETTTAKTNLAESSYGSDSDSRRPPETLDHWTKPREGLSEDPLTNLEEIWYTDGSIFVLDGKGRGECEVVSNFETTEAKPLPPDVQAGFRKGRGTEIKLPTSAGSLKKQESSRKTSISALLIMPKPLTVWITINCGKFCKR